MQRTTPSPHCDFSITPVVFGAMWHRLEGQQAARVRCVHEALDLGITTIDTAPLYDFGGSEQLLSTALRGRFQQVQLLTKVGLRWDSDHGRVMFSTQVQGVLRQVRIDGRPQSVRRDVESSLRRLGTDVLDLVQVHQWDELVPVADTLGELSLLRAEGKLRHVGVSNFPPRAMREAAAAMVNDEPLVTTQNHYSLLARGVERDELPLAHGLGMGMLCYSPLEQGLLAGSLLGLPQSRWPDRGPLFVASNVRAIHVLLQDTMAPLALRHGCSLGGLSLAWLLHQPGVSAVVCGASSSEQLAQNAHAASVRLTAQELHQLRTAAERLRLDWHAGESTRHRLRRLASRAAKAGLRRLKL